MNLGKSFLAADGNFLLWRAWSTSGQTSARPTERIPLQILDWFCSYALRLECQGGLLAFDGNKNFRYDLYKGYKAGRSSGGAGHPVSSGPLQGMTVHDAVYESLEPTRKLFSSLGFVVHQEDRHEADDVLGSAAKVLGVRHDHVYMLCRDKDMVQCINENVTLYTPPMQKQPEVLITPKNAPILKKGLTPRQFLDYQILMGDGVDSVPAVPGMSDGKALAILREHGSLSAYFKTKDGRKFYDLRATELHRNKDLVGLSKKAFPFKAKDILFKSLHGTAKSLAFTTLRDSQRKTSLF